MLMIAMPKSASSALIATLCRRHGLENRTRMIRNQFLLDLPAAMEYTVFLKQHGEMRDLESSAVPALIAPGGITKHHFPPSPANQALLGPCKKVILLRPPEEVVAAYKRGEDSGVFPMRDLDFIYCITEEDWLRKARRIGLLEQMHRFYRGWLEHPGDKLIVQYKELIADPGGTIRAVEQYWDLPASGQTVLDKQKYSRDAGPRSEKGLGRAAILLRRSPRIFRKIARDTLRGLGLWKPDYLHRYKKQTLAEQGSKE